MGELSTKDDRVTGFRNWIEKADTQSAFAAALPSVGITKQRFVRMIVTAFSTNPALYDCSIPSIKRSLIYCAQTGLPPTGKGGIYLIPFKNKGVMEATPVIDYRGMLQIARRSGDIARVTANVVRKCDEFSYKEGTKPFLEHSVGQADPADGSPPPDVTHVYALVHLKSAPELPAFVVLSKSEVEKYRRRSKAPNSPAWVNDWGAMACKTAIRRLYDSGRLPLQDDDHRLMAMMQAEDSGFSLPPTDDEAIPTESVVSDASGDDDAPTLDPEAQSDLQAAVARTMHRDAPKRDLAKERAALDAARAAEAAKQT